MSFEFKYRVKVSVGDKIVDDFYYNKETNEQIIEMAKRVGNCPKPNKAEFTTEIYEDGKLVSDNFLNKVREYLMTQKNNE